MINKITIQNFKSIKDRVEIDIKPITLLFGPNSVGKSTVVQALHYLKEVIQYDNPDPNQTAVGGKSIDFGGFRNIVHRENGDSNDHYKTKNIIIGVEIEESDYIDPETFDQDFLGIDDLIKNAGYVPYFLEFTIAWDERLNRPIVKRYDVSINNMLIGRIEMTGYVSEEIQKYKPPQGTQGEPTKITNENLNEYIKYENIFLRAGANEDVPKFNLKWIDINHPDFILPEELQKEQKRTFDHEAPDGTVVENIFELYMKEFENIILEPTKQAVKGLSGKEFVGTAVPGGIDVDTFIDDYTNSNYTLFFGNHAFPDFRPISLSYGDARYRSEDFIHTKTDTGENFSIDEHSELSEEPYVRSSIEKALTHVFTTPVLLLRDFLNTIRYIGPVRSIPGRDFAPESYNDEHNWSDGLAAWSYIHALINKKIVDKANDIDQINSWMNKLGLGYTIKARSIYKIDEESPLVYGRDDEGNEFEDSNDIRRAFRKIPTTSDAVLIETKNGIEVKPIDVGSGITQVFPMIVACVHDEHSILAIEQPELHIHPRIQQQIADMFITRRYEPTIFLIETHSEHLMLRILRRIEESYSNKLKNPDLEIKANEVSVVYVEPSESGVKMNQLSIDDSGDFNDEWPDGFFEEREEDLF